MINIYTNYSDSKKSNLTTLKNISGFNIDDKSIINPSIIQYAVYSDCHNILKEKEETIYLDNLIDGTLMFLAFSGPEKLFCYAPKLENGQEMFSQIWENDYGHRAEKTLKEYYGDLPSLKCGEYMFYGTNLKEFRGDLLSLEDGYHMFSRFIHWENYEGDWTSYIPDLSPTSVLTIVETIPTYTDGSSHIINIIIHYNQKYVKCYSSNYQNVLQNRSLL